MTMASMRNQGILGKSENAMLQMISK